MSCFTEVKERLTMDEVVRHYGFTPSRSGFVPCPFHHGDRSPSLKVYPGNRGFHCFGCGKGGSVIDFTSELFGLDTMGAVRRLNEDFALGLTLDRKPTKAEKKAAQNRQDITRLHKVFEKWRSSFLIELCAACRVGNTLKFTDWNELTDQEALALRLNAYFDYLIDTLSNGTADEQMQIFRDRGRIKRWTEKVLQPTPMKLVI